MGNGFLGTTMGCEASNMYRGGSTYTYVDGHAKFLRGNAERYLETDSAGCVYKRYFTVDK